MKLEDLEAWQKIPLRMCCNDCNKCHTLYGEENDGPLCKSIYIKCPCGSLVEFILKVD